jgi:hypothetical protein
MALDRQFQIREHKRRQDEEAEARLLLAHTGHDRAERLAAWRGWCAKHLLATFRHWPAEEAAQKHAVGLCIAELEVIAKHLHERAWLFDAKRLAQIVTKVTAPIATAQAAGKIDNFFPYFRRSVRAYVGMQAEELQQQARRDGVDGASAIGDVLAGVFGRLRTPSIVEDLADRRQEARQDACKPSARGRPPKFKAAADATLDLFGAGGGGL